MKYYKFTMNTPYCGTEETVYEAYEEDPTIEELNEKAEELSQLHAEGYEYLVAGWGEEPSVEELDEYYADCSCDWEEVTREEYVESV